MRGLWPLWAAAFLDLLGFGMFIPDVQLRAEALGAPGWVIGLVLASMFVVQFLVSPWWGVLSDRIGRKPVFLVCTSLSAAGMAVYAMHDSVWAIVISRVLAGLGAANVAVAQAYVVDTVERDRQTAFLGKLGAATTAGLIGGAAVVSVLARFGWLPWLGYVGAAASGMGFLVVAAFLPHRPPAIEQRPEKRAMVDFSLFRRDGLLLRMAAIAVVSWFALAMLEGTFGRLIRHNLGFGQFEFGVVFGFESVLTVLVQATLVAWVAARYPERTTLRLCYVGMGVGLASYPFANGMAGLLVGSTLYAVGLGLAGPILNAVCSRRTAEERQGELFGALQSARSIGYMIGPVLGGALFDLYPASPYLVAGVVCLSAAALVPRIEEASYSAA
ncbi:MAG: MFS transporter [Fimbriimonadaceae bacterium]|nr:MFS transporter [Fimbriimonadaceae bacterium]